MKTIRITHWIFTGLLGALLTMSALMYFMKNDMVAETFTNLGFPTWVIYPLAIAKLLAVFMLITKWKSWLTNWAYAGIFFNVLLALTGHLMVGDGEHMGAVIALILLLGSFSTWNLGWKR